MNNSSVIVRPVKLSDAVDLHENCFSKNTLDQVQSRIEANLQICEERNGVQLVAELDGVVVGTVELQRRDSSLRSHRAELYSLVVTGKYQGQGIARLLVEESHTFAALMGVKILEIGCRGGEPAEQIYPRLGFVEFSRLPGGLKETWGEQKVYDEVYFYQPVKKVSKG